MQLSEDAASCSASFPTSAPQHSPTSPYKAPVGAEPCCCWPLQASSVGLSMALQGLEGEREAVRLFPTQPQAPTGLCHVPIHREKITLHCWIVNRWSAFPRQPLLRGWKPHAVMVLKHVGTWDKQDEFATNRQQ